VTLACRNCGSVPARGEHPINGNYLCQPCQLEGWERERARPLHPAGKNVERVGEVPTGAYGGTASEPKVVAKVAARSTLRRRSFYGYSPHTCTPHCPHEITKAIREESL